MKCLFQSLELLCSYVRIGNNFYTFFLLVTDNFILIEKKRETDNQ